MLDELRALGVNLDHFELASMSRHWRLTSLCDRARWITAPQDWSAPDAAKRLSRITKCCLSGTLRRAEVDRFGQK